MTRDFGIGAENVAAIAALFRKFPAVREAVIFGSRAKGTQAEGSDIDIALMGSPISTADLVRMEMAYDKLYLPWKLDIVVYDAIENTALKEHIERVGMRVD